MSRKARTVNELGKGEEGGEFFCGAIGISTFSRFFDEAVSTSLTYSPTVADGDSNSWFIEVHLLSQGASSIVEGVFSPHFPSFEADTSGPEVSFCRSIPSIFIPFFRIIKVSEVVATSTAKTERDSFPSFRSSIKRLLSSVSRYQHIVFPRPKPWFHCWLRFSTFAARFVTEIAIISSFCVVAMSMESLPIIIRFPSTLRFGDDVINLYL